MTLTERALKIVPKVVLPSKMNNKSSCKVFIEELSQVLAKIMTA
jgi:hypothetical protein